MFTADEQRVLNEHGLAVFRGKVIYDAQAGITPEQEKEVAAKLSGPLPEDLLALWRTCFGGRLDYDLTAAFGKHRYSASFRELFFPGSDGYRDLGGWMDHDLELAQEAAESRGASPPSKLGVLPFGGFEYLERLYVELGGEHPGQVLLWAQGLPPAWKMRLTQDSVCVLAPSVNALFDMLCLDQDPTTAEPGSYPRGLEALEAIDALREGHPDLADKLERLLRASVFAWREVIAQRYEGTAEQDRAGQLAAQQAARKDDLSLLETMIEGGYPLDGVISGEATLLALCIAQSAFAVARRLLSSGRPLGEVTIVRAGAIDGELTQLLLNADVGWDIEAPLAMAEKGQVAPAVVVILEGRHEGDWDDLRGAILERAERHMDSARRVEEGRLHSSLTPDDYRERYANLKRLAHEL